MTDATHFSRPYLAAASLGVSAADSHKFKDKKVLLEADDTFLSYKNGRLCFLYSLYLLPRFCAHVTAWIPPSFNGFRRQCEAEAQRIALAGPIRFLDSAPTRHEFDAILKVGREVIANQDRTVVANSNGWVARVSRCDMRSADSSQTNPIGALAAASWACAEIFKILVDLNESRGAPFKDVSYSLFEHGLSENLGPELPSELCGDVLLLGNGAIGNAVIMVAHDLPLSGIWHVVDYQKFRPENLGTCMLVGPTDVDVPKASVAERYSTQTWHVYGFTERIENYRNRVDSEIPHPWIILTAPDEIEPRRIAQSFWPDVVINGAIGTFEAEVGVHPAGANVACLRCIYRQTAGVDYVAKVAQATGLAPDRVAGEGDSLVTEADVMGAPAEHNDWLAQRVGKQICAIAEEGLTRSISNRPDLDIGFRPSLPFVASLSASFMMAELVKYLMDQPTTLAPRIQHDILQGPRTALPFPQHRRRDCECVTRERNIAKFRAQLKLNTINGD